MAETRRDVEIGLKARDAYSGEFAKLSKRIEGVRAEAAGIAGSLGGMKAMAAGFATIGGAQGAVQLATAAVKAFRGDAEGAAEVLERLPFGIGGVVRSLRELTDATKGMGELRERLDEASKAAQQLARENATAFSALQGNLTAFGPFAEKLREEIRLLSVEGLDREAEQAAIAAEARGRALEQMNDRLRASAQAAQQAARHEAQALREELALVREEYHKTGSIKRAIELQERKAQLEGLIDRRDAEAEAARKVLELQEQQIPAIQRLIDERNRLEREAVEERRRLHQQEIDERLERERQAQQERTALEEKRLTEERQREQDRLLRAAQQRVQPSGVAPIGARFITRAPEGLFAAQRGTAEAQLLARMNALQQQGIETTKEVRDILTRIERDRTIIRVENN